MRYIKEYNEYHPNEDTVKRWCDYLDNNYPIKHDSDKFIVIDDKSYFLTGILFNKGRLVNKIFSDIFYSDKMSGSKIDRPSLRKAIKNWVDINSDKSVNENLDKLNFKPIIESLSNQKKEYYYRISAPKYNESVEYDENPYNMLNKIRNLISPSNPIYKSVNNDDNVISFTVNKKVLDDYPDRMRGDDLSIKFIKDEYFRVKYISRNAFNFKYFECDQFEGLIQLLKDMGLKLNERVMESKLDRPNYKKLDIDGFIVYQGKDAKSNDYVTFELSDDEDYWLHAHNFPGSHLLIKIKDKLPQIETIKKVAELAAKNSKAPNGDVVVVWCKKKFVKKEISMNIGQVKVDYINSNKITIVK